MLLIQEVNLTWHKTERGGAPAKHPMQLAFEQNLKFLHQPEYADKFWQGLFAGERVQTLELGRTDFPTGEVVLADYVYQRFG